jgi:hypothetical protein
LNHTDVLFAVEWANDPKITYYRFYAENTTHTFELVVHYLTKPLNNFTLTYQSACRLNTKFDSCKGEVRWNGNLVESITPSDYKIHNSTISVPILDKNVLSLKGTGTSDGYGLTVDNFNLHKLGSTQNYIVNGDFELPNLNHGWQNLKNPTGWTGDVIEIGYGPIYNSEWTTQVCELDAESN